MTVKKIPISPRKFIGASGDTKPSGVEVPIGSTFFEQDTYAMYITYDDGTNWVLKDQIGEVKASPTAYTALARLKALEGYVDGIEADSLAIKTAIQGLQAVVGAVGVNADVDGLMLAQLRYIGEAFASLYSGPPTAVTTASDDTAGGATLYTGAAKLYWLIFTKETANVGFCKILDGTSGSTGFLTIYVPGETSVPMTFNPPWQFDTGIRNGGMSAGAELVIGYVADA